MPGSTPLRGKMDFAHVTPVLDPITADAIAELELALRLLVG